MMDTVTAVLGSSVGSERWMLGWTFARSVELRGLAKSVGFPTAQLRVMCMLGVYGMERGPSAAS